SEMMPGLNVPSLSLVAFLRHINIDPDVRNRDQVENLILNHEPLQLNRVDQDTELVINFNATGDTLANRLVAASIVDVSEIRRSERSRAELIDFLSHDLRSPLISSLYLLKAEDTVRGEAPAEKIERIENNINLSLRMIDDLLSIARADNLTTEAFVPVLFDSIVDNAVDRLSPQARSVEIQFDVDTRDDDLWMDGDAGLLERAMVNIVGNAIKYSPGGTTIQIVTERHGDQVVCRVIDQGIGIAPDMMKNLFKRFKRDATVASTVEGIGLGLALVAKVVSQHGGTIEAHSGSGAEPASSSMATAPDGSDDLNLPTTGKNSGTEIQVTLPLNVKLTDDQSAVA
ncbi:MAG: HAMP domain-containing histidine kinase, partial [Granulosicoccus sp.]|nr:HAMP domain-containing histidine kinase [Granulosicoccus sp.]